MSGARRAGELAVKRANRYRFHRGIIFKEGVPLALYGASCRAPGNSLSLKPVANEWRLWFATGACRPLPASGDQKVPGGGILEEPKLVTKGTLLCASPNSRQDAEKVDQVLDVLLGVCAELAVRVGNPYVTVDVAETEDEIDGDARWIVREIGDGGVSGPALIVAQCFDVKAAADRCRGTADVT